ncbi:MAG: CHAT domain-containing tetratricopeptide repeat protein [Microscillaceae bacterium]|nr:CHAT domain-containing tetratricopeptide repeat protein [Microscillaceae bacterium]
MCFSLYYCTSWDFGNAQIKANHPPDQLIDSAITEIEKTIFYDDYKKTTRSFDTLMQFAQENHRWKQYFDIIIFKGYAAMWHSDLEIIRQTVELGFLELNKLAKKLDKKKAEETKYNLLYNKAFLESSLGDFEACLATHRQRLSLKIAKDSLEKSNLHDAIAKALVKLERYDEALQQYSSSILYLPQKSDVYDDVFNSDYEYALKLGSIGEIFQLKFQMEKNNEYFTRAKEYAKKGLSVLSNHRDILLSNNKPDKKLFNLLSTQYTNLASLYKESNQYDSAYYYLEKGKPFLKNKLHQIRYNLSAGDIHHAAQKYPQAIQAYDSAYQIAREFYPGVHPNKALALQKIGEVYAAQKSYEKAIQHYQKAITQLDSTFQYKHNLALNPNLKNVFWNKDLLQILVLKAQAYQLWATQKQPNLQKLQTAQKTYHLATELVDQIRQNFNLKEHSELLSERFYGLYEQALSNALAIKSLQKNQEAVHAEIFYLFEKSRSAVLLESHQKWASQSNHLLPDSLTEREKLYLGEIYLLKNKIYDTEKENEKSELLSKLLKTESNYEQFVEALKKNYPAYYSFKHQTKVLSLQEAQQKLSADPTQIVSYLFGEKHIYGMGIDSKQLIIRQIPRTDELENDLSQLISHIKDEKKIGSQDAFVQYNQLAYTNYQNLLAPFLTQHKKSIQKLVIIPDGLLCYLPFEVLHTEASPASKPINFVDLPYLLHRFALRYEYSITLLLDKSQHSTSSKASNQYLGFAPQYENNDFLGSKRSFSEEFPLSKRSTGELKHNRTEITYSSKLFAGQSFVGAEATKANFLRYAENCKGILHLSMHGLVNDSLPDQSCLVFGKVSTSQKRGTKTVSGESPLLYAYELYNMQIPAEMVILSACETGIGKLSRGEGILSIGRAFKLAGTQNLVMSYWAVDDESTSKLIQLFLKNLKAGMDKDLALQKAKLSYLQAKGTAHQLAPHFWAAFVLVGDDLPLQSQQNSWSYLFYALLAAILGVGIFWAWRKFY